MFNAINNKDKTYLMNKIFIGIVEENKDEKRKGRVKVRVQGIYNDIPLDHIPWASPYVGLDGKNFRVPAIGKAVNVIFFNGELYEPQYLYSENLNINLQDKLDSLSDDEYVNFTALLYDHRCQISADDSGLHLDYFENVIRIKNNSIDVKLKDNTQRLNIGHSDCNQDAVLGSNFFKWMDGFMQTLLTPSTLIGNIGAPILRPALDQKITEYNQLRQTFVSDCVKIVDNNKITKDDYNNNRNSTPTKDDNTIVDNKKILEKTDKPPTDNEKKLQDSVKDDRTKEMEKKVDNQPSEVQSKKEDETPIEEEHPEQFEPDPTEEAAKEKQKEDATEQMNENPYAGFWAGTKGSSANKNKYQDENSQTGYGRYSTKAPVVDEAGKTDGVSGSVASDATPVPIKTALDKILKIAGDWAQKVGLNKNVKYENLNHGYIKVVHGKCPQGTKAVLFGMTGDNSFKNYMGNANWYSFDPTYGGKASFDKTGYFLPKKKIDYADYVKNKSKWQVGDVIAMGYKAASYGHIQVWTGTYWMSDFKQNAPHVGSGAHKFASDTVALWRMNSKGLDVVKKRMDDINSGKVKV